MSRIVVIGFTTSRCIHGKVIRQSCARRLVRNGDFKAIATYAAHLVPTGSEAPGPVEVFAGVEGDFHTAIGVGGGSGISHRRTIGHGGGSIIASCTAR